MADSKSKEMVKAAIEAMKDKKAEDIRVIDISNVSVIADYFIIANGNNPNQVQAIVDNVEEQLYKAGFADPKVEGYNSASWILLDYEDVIMYFQRKTDFSIILKEYGVTELKSILKKSRKTNINKNII